MDAGLRINNYEWAGGHEPMLRFGPESGPTVALALPLLEEANRTRAFGVSLLRALAARGISGILPELPGQGESEVATQRATLADMRAAFASACGERPVYSLGLRSGALLDSEARLAGRWLLAPQNGSDLLRELARVAGAPIEPGDAARAAGNLLGRTLVKGLSAADAAETDVPSRVVRLTSDPRPADRKIDAPPLWRRAEPDSDSALSQYLANDIADWIAACED